MRVLAFMIVAACALAGGACSNILGLQNPTPAGGGDGGGDDGPPVSGRLVFNVESLQIKKQQRVRVHVTAVDGSAMQDVTDRVSYSSNDASVADGSAGRIEGGTSMGTATITARLGAAEPATLTVTVVDKPCRPVINEFQTGKTGTNQADNEWVEILNSCATTFTFTPSWTLVYRSVNDTADVTLVSLTGDLAPDAIKLFGGPQYNGTKDGGWTTGTLAQASGAIGIRMGAPGGATPLADSVGYGVASTHSLVEGDTILAMANDKVAQRLPFDGRDDDNGPMDFMELVSTGTPGALNVP